jgi:purine nucleoside permease
VIRLLAALLALVTGVTVAAAQPATRPAATAEVVVLTSFPETEWDGVAKAAYAKARELAESAPARIR